jgi:flagellar protein FlgJ
MPRLAIGKVKQIPEGYNMDIGKITGDSTQNLIDGAASSVTRSTDDSFARKLENAVQNKDDKELKKACQEFEGIMLNILYKSMKATIIKSDLAAQDPGMDIFESMQDDNLMEQASKTGTFGLAESLYRQLSGNSGKGVKNADKETVQENQSVSEKSEK